MASHLPAKHKLLLTAQPYPAPAPTGVQHVASRARRGALVSTASLALPAFAGDFRWWFRKPAETGIDAFFASAVVANAVGTATPIKQYPGASWVPWSDTEPAPFVSGALGIDAGYVAETPTEILVVFRPTLPGTLLKPAVLIDWLNDFNAIPVTAKGMPGQVHKGFWTAMLALMQTGLPQEIRRRQAARRKPVTVLGYSKGGGMAPLAAMWLISQGITASKVILFEAPRCGDDRFLQAYDKQFPQTTRYEFQDDVIVHFPPTQETLDILARIPLLGPLLAIIFGPYTQWNYKAVGRLQFIDWDLKIRESSAALTQQRALHLLQTVLSANYKKVFRDHLPCGPASGLAPGRKCPWDYFRML